MIGYCVIFGASGDLTSRYLLPTLAQLQRAQKLRADMQIIGIAPEDWDSAFFQTYVRGRLKLHAPEALELWTGDLSARLEYRKADVTRPEQVQAALASLNQAAVLYLALPPKVLVLATVGSLILLRFLPRLPFGKRLILETGLAAGEGYASPPETDRSWLGKGGIAVSPLRPSGIADVEGERVDVVSDGEFLEAGAQIVVSRVDGNRIVVRRRRA
jgi:hypothetical protein